MKNCIFKLFRGFFLFYVFLIFIFDSCVNSHKENYAFCSFTDSEPVSDKWYEVVLQQPRLNLKNKLGVIVRYNKNYAYEYLPLVVEINTDKLMHPMEDTLNMILFNRDIEPTGKGSLGLFEINRKLYQDIPFDSIINVSFKTDIPDIKGINQIGFYILQD